MCKVMGLGEESRKTNWEKEFSHEEVKKEVEKAARELPAALVQLAR